MGSGDLVDQFMKVCIVCLKKKGCSMCSKMNWNYSLPSAPFISSHGVLYHSVLKTFAMLFLTFPITIYRERRWFSPALRKRATERISLLTSRALALLLRERLLVVMEIDIGVESQVEYILTTQAPKK